MEPSSYAVGMTKSWNDTPYKSHTLFTSGQLLHTNYNTVVEYNLRYLPFFTHSTSTELEASPVMSVLNGKFLADGY